MEFNLNGEKRNYEGDPNLNLMDYLRNTEKIISPKAVSYTHLTLPTILLV